MIHLWHRQPNLEKASRKRDEKLEKIEQTILDLVKEAYRLQWTYCKPPAPEVEKSIKGIG